MTYDESLAGRVRALLQDLPNVGERKMFGGLAFMVQGNMCCGVLNGELMVRVGADAYAEALSQPHARPMDFTGRPMVGFLYVGSPGLASEQGLAAWIQRSLDFILTLPPK